MSEGAVQGGAQVEPRRGLRRIVVHEVRDGRSQRRPDDLVVEEPMEIRLVLPGRPEALRLTVTMRTPGHDFELAAGFLQSEGVIRQREDIAAISYCVEGPQAQRYNVVNVALRPGVTFDPETLVRHVYTTSSCGVCGKASIEAVRLQGLRPVGAGLSVSADLVVALPETLRREQSLFERTGGLHAAALFDAQGRLESLREDVGRHNAVDKLVGQRLLAGALPLSQSILLVSGRASFEIMQKALAAGIPAVCAVSAPSSLAVELAREFGMILIGFLRGNRFNVYAGEGRVTLGAP